MTYLPCIEKLDYFVIINNMKKVFLVLLGMFFGIFNMCSAYDECNLRNYSEIEVPNGTFIQVMSNQEISTLYSDIGSNVQFTATTDLYLREINIIPKNTIFYGFVEKINEPVVGTHASMKIKITKLKLPDGFELAMQGYIYTTNGNLIGGGITEPASYIKKASYRKWFKPMVGLVPGPSLKMGEHTIIASGADLLIVLVGPLPITHTVTN